MSASSPDNAISSGKLTRVIIYIALLVFAFYFLLPLYVMVVNSLKTLDEIRQGACCRRRANGPSSLGWQPGLRHRLACSRQG